MTLTAILIIISRFLLGLYFFQAGIRNVMKFGLHVSILEKKNMPLVTPGLAIALAVQLLGGLSVGLGIFPAIGALGLIVFTIAANVLYHNFWSYSGAERTSHLGSVLTNLAIIGGLLLVIALSI